ncbi:predicted protein [Bacteroides sp. CAG:661]|nr:predicted protein [Bacteroides sp. CAG:661]
MDFFLSVGPTVTYEDAFVILYCRHILAADSAVLAQAVGWYVLQPCRKRERQFAAGIHVAHQHSCQRCARFRTQIPALHDGSHLSGPGHCHGVARDVYDNQVGVCPGQGFNQFILTIRKRQVLAVGVFAVLSITLVQSADKDDAIGFGSNLHGFCLQFGSRTGFLQVLPRHHTVIFAGFVTHIATGIDYLGLVAYPPADAFQRRNLMLGFQRRAASAHGHHLQGILADNGNLPNPSKVNGQHAVLVLQQHNALFTNLAGSRIVFGRTHRAPGSAGIHHSSEGQTQHTSHLVVEFIHACPSVFQTLQIGLGQVIIVVRIACTRGKPVGPRTELQVEPVGNGLLRVVRAAPVRNDHTVEAPLSFQDVLQEIFVVAAVLALVQVVRAHDGPCLALLHSGLEGRQIDFIQGTVVHHDIQCRAIDFLIVQRKVLDAGRHAVLLHALYIGNNHP